MRRVARRVAKIAAAVVVVFIAASVVLGAVTSPQAAAPSKPAPAVHVNIQDGAGLGSKPAPILKTTTR